MKPFFSAIVARSTNGYISKGDKLPWYCPNDLRRFRLLTVGKICVMGRTTYLHTPSLDNRYSMVLSHDFPKDELSARPLRNGGVVASLPEMLEQCKDMVDTKGYHPEIMVIGGASIYQQLIPYCQRLYLTTVKIHVEGGDHKFDYNTQEWVSVCRQENFDMANKDDVFDIFERDVQLVQTC